MTWQADFAPDGSLRDICIRHVALEDWNAVIHLIEAAYQPIRFVVGEEERREIDRTKIFGGAEVRPVLLFQAGPVELACHFFREDEIEFDFNPNSIRTEQELQPLLRFVREISVVTQKPAVITPENQHDVEIFRFSVETGTVEYLPPPSN